VYIGRRAAIHGGANSTQPFSAGGRCTRAMTAPRRIVPGDVYFITRRCTQREFLLRPDDTTNQIFEYCLAEAAERYDVGLIAWTPMSNHYHSVVHDPHGRLPAFIEHLHKMIAKCLNHRWGRWENFWSSEETCVTRLVTNHDILEKVLYVLCNPIAGDLVDRVADWPGSSSLGHLMGKERTIRRPKGGYFKTDGKMPKEVTLRTIVPPCITKHESATSWRVRVRNALAEREKTIRTVRAQEKRRVLGRKAVLRTLPTQAPPSTAIHRKLRPCVACKDPERLDRELAALKLFRARYRAIRDRWMAGDKRAVFPAGTYRMRLLGQPCAPFM
jgi:putative transposase